MKVLPRPEALRPMIKPKPLFAHLTTAEVVKRTKRLLPNQAGMEALLKRKPEEIFALLYPALKPAPLTPEIEISVNAERARLVENARSAWEKIKQYGVDAKLTPGQHWAFCSILAPYARPASIIQNGHFQAFQPGSDWKFLEQPPYRDRIEKTFESIGRIEFQHSDGTEWSMGTGFLVADNVMMTNGHVGELFCTQDAISKEWTFNLDSKRRRIDYCEELDAATSREFKIKEIIAISDEHDLALFKVAKTSLGRKHPEPLVLAGGMPDPVKDRNVYVVGYPVKDETRETAEDLSRLFNDIYGVKRLQPGKTTGVQLEEEVLFHDCSTVAGNSGSCVIDIELNQVVGLHFRGAYLEEYNEAIPLPMLKDDPALKKAGVNFAK